MTPKVQYPKTQKSATRVLPPDVFDALELSALAYGGIGWNVWCCFGVPVCYVGHLAFVGAVEEARTARSPFGISEDMNDAVFSHATEDRIPFAEWCRRLNVVRGDEPTFDSANFPKRSPAKKRGSA